MKNKKTTKKEKMILGVEALLILGAVFYIYLSSAVANAPIIGKSILEPDLIIEIEKGETVLISPNKDFIEPIVLETDSEIQLPPGTYYYKIKNWLRESEIKSFTIESRVGLNLYERAENYELENSGNVDLEVSGKSSGMTTNLEVGESIEVKEEDVYEGSQN